MKGIYYIENSLDERRSGISGYFETEDAAREGLKFCSDWFRSNGTGRIYFREFGLHGKTTLIYEK